MGNITKILRTHRQDEASKKPPEYRESENEPVAREIQISQSAIIQEVLTALKTKLAEKATILFNIAPDGKLFSENAHALAYEGNVIRKVINLIETNKYE